MSAVKRKKERAMSPACREIRRRLSEYLDGHISQERCEAIQRHVAECRDCGALANTLGSTVNFCRRLPSEVIPMDVRHRLKAALRARLATGPSREPRGRRG